MKKVMVIIIVLLSVAIVVTGKLHWNDKIQANAKAAKNAEVEKPERVNVKTAVEENQEKKIHEVESYSKNLPQEIQTKLITAMQNGEPLNLVIAGSDSTPEDLLGWSTLLKNELENTYGKDILNITIKEIAEKTSTQILQEELYREIIGLSPDILLFEPFILYDNGKVRLEERLININEILDAIKVSVPDVSVILQPANPLYNAIRYPVEVEKLKDYAEENNLTYLNHWEAWPDYQSGEIIPYLIDGVPSQKGHEVWAEYLIKYFISKER